MKNRGGAMRLLLLMTLITLTACHSGWDQDPFAEDNVNVKNAVPQGGNKNITPPLRDVMRIDVNNTFVMKEGQKKIIPLEYRLLHPEFHFVKMEIKELESELPGATYDPVTRELVFEPEENYVPAGAIIFSSIVRISLFAEFKGLQQEVRQEVVFHVIRGSATGPKIEKVEGLAAELMEGTTSSFKIYIRDEISPSGPILVFTKPSQFFKNGAQYIEHKTASQVPNDPTLWEFDATVDLQTPVDVTRRVTKFKTHIQAYSALGIPANPFPITYTVNTKAQKPKFFIERRPKFTVGERSVYSFSVVDTKAEGRVVAQFIDDCGVKLKGTASCKCMSLLGSYAGSARCTIDWIPSKVGIVQLNVEATNTVNSTIQAKDQATNRVVLSMEVVEAGGVQ